MTEFRRSTTSVRARRLRPAGTDPASYARHSHSSVLGVSLLSETCSTASGCRGGSAPLPSRARRLPWGCRAQPRLIAFGHIPTAPADRTTSPQLFRLDPDAQHQFTPAIARRGGGRRDGGPWLSSPSLPVPRWGCEHSGVTQIVGRPAGASLGTACRCRADPISTPEAWQIPPTPGAGRPVLGRWRVLRAVPPSPSAGRSPSFQRAESGSSRQRPAVAGGAPAEPVKQWALAGGYA